MKVVIFTNGDPPDPVLTKMLVDQHDLVMAVDGAAHYLAQHEISPHIICGDFDFIRLDEAKQHFQQSEFVQLSDQNYGDLEKAIHLAKERGATRITIAGAIGGRLDHTLGNILLLARYHKEVSLSIVQGSAEMLVISGKEDVVGRITLSTKPHDTISLFALAEGVKATVTNVQWPLQNEILPMGTHGVSNIAVAHEVEIHVTSGMLAVCHSKHS